MEIKVVEDISTEPVTPEEAKSYAKISTSDDDTLITSMVKSARIAVENLTEKCVAQKTIDVFAYEDDFENGRLRLPFSPIDVSSVAVYDVDAYRTETLITLNSDYTLHGLNDIEIKIANIYSESLSSLQVTHKRIRYNVGYGISGQTETLPSIFEEAIKKQVTEWYNNREAYNPDNLSNEVYSMLFSYIKQPIL